MSSKIEKCTNIQDELLLFLLATKRSDNFMKVDAYKDAKMWKSFILVCLIIMLPLYCVQAQEVKMAEKHIELTSTCAINESDIFVKLIGECGGEEFELTEKAHRLISGSNGQVITSWNDFLQFKKDFKARFFEKNITKEYFREYNLGVVYVWHTGSRVIKNEKLYETKNKCVFGYEIWDTRKPAPACVWQTLYLLRLSRIK